MTKPHRTRLSDLEAALNLFIGPALKFRGNILPRAIAMTDVDRSPDTEELISGLPRNSAIILRHPDPEKLFKLVQKTLPKARKKGHKILISDAPNLAQKFGADGVHLPEAVVRSRPFVTWARFNPKCLITTSAHSAWALRRAYTAGADAALLSPILSTASHPSLKPLGYLRFRTLSRFALIPTYALGGIKPNIIRQLKGADCSGVAGVEMFQSFGRQGFLREN